jgi:hypothetical protein
VSEAQEQWQRCKPWIEEALEYTNGMYDIEDIERAISDGTMMLMPGEHSALVLEIITYPNGKALNVFAGGGEPGKTMREYVERLDACVIALAKTFDCRWVMHHTRRSGERIGERLGYKKLCAVMVKEIAN